MPSTRDHDFAYGTEKVNQKSYCPTEVYQIKRLQEPPTVRRHQQIHVPTSQIFCAKIVHCISIHMIVKKQFFLLTCQSSRSRPCSYPDLYIQLTGAVTLNWSKNVKSLQCGNVDLPLFQTPFDVGKKVKNRKQEMSVKRQTGLLLK